MQEENTIPSLRKALKDVSIEKDAAVVGKVLLQINLLHLFFYVVLLSDCLE